MEPIPVKSCKGILAAISLGIAAFTGMTSFPSEFCPTGGFVPHNTLSAATALSSSGILAVNLWTVVCAFRRSTLAFSKARSFSWSAI